ncbi:MAG: HAMP domain-containing histidine kinase [Candidatus Omnitrophica bacterium]|nr:HAMP domain-containing histidine kinase [Candidatus Omnitrophota bacterium]
MELILNPYNLVLVVAGFIIVVLIVILINNLERTKQLRNEIIQLKRTIDEIDLQSRTLIQTDMELNKIQDELNKKIIALYALHRISRQVSSTLDENKIFSSIENSHLEDMGFEKALAFLWDDKKENFELVLNIGYEDKEIDSIVKRLDKDFYLKLMQEGKTASSISVSEETLIKSICDLFNIYFFVISPILPKEGRKGFLFVGTDDLSKTITQGDEDLINILANQIGQTLDNARLFEKTWLAQQELEKKVEERTKQLSTALEEIQAISKRKSEFISAVSHELRTPLTSIKGYASILLAEKLGNLPLAVKERLEKINRHTDELVNLVNGLLDISRIESGKIAMKFEPYKLSQIINEVLDLMGVQLKEKEIQLTTEISADSEDILVDCEQLKRVFINLIGNAIKFTPSKGKITIKSFSLDHQIQVDITDTGIGIPQDSLQVIFEEFYRVDNPINQQVKGTGLGLSLVKRIIEAHRGKIWVKSKLNEGSTFSFTLPKVI